MKYPIQLIVFITLLLSSGCEQKNKSTFENRYEADWASLRDHQTPQWLKDGKFGIYTHWGIYCYSAVQGNATWNSSLAYMDPESDWAQDFYRVHGPLTLDFGYKDLIPKFTGENFDAREWAELFAKSGARFAGPVAEHHDGFAMWDTKYSEWNAAKMGPKRDVVGELEKAIKGEGMKFVTAFHHAENWFFFPTWDSTKDCSNPAYSGLYGPIHEEGDVPNEEFLEEWYGKLIEVVNNYDPDFVWFDFGLDIIRENYVKDFVAYYYNKATANDKEVVISYKHHDLPPGVGLYDLELGQEDELTHYDWITDTSIDEQNAWGYIPNLEYKSVNRLIDNLVDRVSKNGYLLLNVGPKWDGTIPQGAQEALLGMGAWLDINGEAIYGTTVWTKSGEGPFEDEQWEEENEGEELDEEEEDEQYEDFTSEDIRYTVKGNIIYAIILDWPGESVLIKSLVRPVNEWSEEGEEIEGRKVWGYVDLDEDADDHIAGYYLYPDEIQSISMLGDGRELDWELIPAQGLSVQMPEERPCDHAYVLKIVRQ